MSTICRSALSTVVALLLWSIVPGLVGFQTTVVMSGSMAPALNVGDVVVVRSVEAAQLHEGQVLLFDDPDQPGELRMHRLASMADDGLVTRGDANADADSSKVGLAAVHGAGFLRVPFAGLPEYLVKTHQPAPLVLGGLGALVLLAGMRLDRRLEDPEARRRRRHRGVKLPPRRRAAALGLVLLAGAGVIVPAHQSSADARYTSRTNTNASWGTACGDRALPAVGTAPVFLWSYGRGDGTADSGANGNTAVFSSISRTSCELGFSPSVALNGSSSVIVASKSSDYSNAATVATWFKVQTGNAGGVLADYSNSSGSGASSRYDKVLYMQDTGSLTFAVATVQAVGLVLSGYQYCTFPGNYADGQWHLVVAGVNSAGCAITVDNQTAVAKPFGLTLFLLPMSGYWRFGYDVTTLANAPTRPYFKGSLDESQVYSTALDSTAAAKIWATGRGH